MVTETDVPFDVTRFASRPYGDVVNGAGRSRAEVDKQFRGVLTGTSAGVMIGCGRGADPTAGAGYVVPERFTGTLDGAHGTVVFQHGGVMGPGVAPATFGNVVSGLGKGAFAGMIGTRTIAADAGRILHLCYEIA